MDKTHAHRYDEHVRPVHHALRHKRPHRFNIGDRAGNNLPHLRLVVVSEGQMLHLVVKFVADVVGHVLAHALTEEPLTKGDNSPQQAQAQQQQRGLKDQLWMRHTEG